MPPNIFLTGSTGYIGGSVLHTLTTAHPSWPITVLLRKIPPAFPSTYPSAKIVVGDYDSTALLAAEAAAADIVVHCGDSDHEASLRALLEGLVKRETPGYLVHLSGTGIVADWGEEAGLGRLSSRVWSDGDERDLEDIRNLPEGALHRGTERMLHAAVEELAGRVNVAIVCPPDIYGRGKGLGRTASVMVPLYVKEARGVGGAFYYGEGANTRSWVHVDDLMRVYLRVVEAAAEGGEEERKSYFGRNGYHFAATQELSQWDFAAAAGKIMAEKGVVDAAEPVQVDLATLDAMASMPNYPQLARYLFASNARTRADRARALWGYVGTAPGLMEELEREIGDALGED